MACSYWRIASSVRPWLSEGDTELVVGLGVIRVQAEGFLELADRLIHLPLRGERAGEVDVGLGVIGFEAERFLELADRLVQLAFVAEGGAEVDVRDPGGRILRQSEPP